MSAPGILDLVPRYARHLRGDGLADRTIGSYTYVMRQLAAWLGEGATVDRLTRGTVLEYRNTRAEGRTAKTVYSDLSAIRSFAQWAIGEGLLSADPTKGIKFPKPRRPLPKALQPAQVRQLLEAIAVPARGLTPHERFQWSRNRRAILLCLYAGLRIGEAAALRWEAVDLEARVITVHYGKGGKSRTVPIHPVLLAELHQAAQARRPELDTHAIGIWEGGPLRTKSAEHIFGRWLPDMLRLRQVEGLELSAHTLRHTFASALVRRGIPLVDVQQLLGHDSVETTQIYLRVAPEHLRGAVDALPGNGWS